MALSTYQDIKGAVTNWLARDDIAAVVPDFITMAEKRIGRLLKAVPMETTASTTPTDSLYYSLPTQLVEIRNLYINSSPTVKLVYRTPEQLMTEYPTESSPVEAYTIVDGQIKLSGVLGAGTEGNLVCVYFRSLNPLTDENNSNWLTQNAPDLLLYGSLIAAEMYIVNDARMPMWKQEFNEILAGINLQADKIRHSGSALQVRSD